MNLEYHPLYCEENAFRNCRSLIAGQVDGRRYDEAALLFIFSTDKYVRVEMQRQPPGVVYWDYHAVAVGRRDDSAPWLVFDPDSLVPPGSTAMVYLKASFPNTDSARRFRFLPIVPGRADFGSDRSHMRRSDGRWLAPPPPWEPINPEVANLPRLIRPDPPAAPFESAPSITTEELIGLLTSSSVEPSPSDA